MEKEILLLACCLFFINETLGSPSPDSMQSVTVKNCGKSIVPKSSRGRIVGGRKTKPGQYPWMISLFEDAGYGFRHICGGSILNENWIITAAHCIDFPNKPSKYVAYAGLHKLSQLKAPTVQKLTISKIYLHDDYNPESYKNDIALLKTAKPIDIAGSKGYINGICLPTSNRDPEGYAVVSGWGHTYEDGENSNTLLGAVVPIIEPDLCNEAYDEDPDDDVDEITETMICAGMAKRDSCQNDSGGPLFQTNSGGTSTLIGVVSYGAGCGIKYYPGVYTRVSLFKQWIQSIVLNNDIQ